MVPHPDPAFVILLVGRGPESLGGLSLSPIDYHFPFGRVSLKAGMPPRRKISSRAADRSQCLPVSSGKGAVWKGEHDQHMLRVVLSSETWRPGHCDGGTVHGSIVS